MTVTTPAGVFRQDETTDMKRFAIAIALFPAATGFGAGPAAARGWDAGGAFVQVQSQKGRQGDQGQGPERGDRDRSRDARQDRQDERRDRMSEDDRRSLHRDLDKANRELYGRRFPK